MGKKGKVFEGEPNINGCKAVPYNTFHLNWQTRISKENNAQLPEGWSESASTPAKLDPREWEFVPIGGGHSRNNDSKGFAMTFGGGSWHASGGVRSMQREGFGDPHGNLKKAEAFRSGTVQLGMSASSPSLGRVQKPADASVKAEVMRAMMQRSVAGVLRHPEEYQLGSLPHKAAHGAPKDEPGILGNSEYRRPQDASISAQVMRAMPNRSVASVLRNAEQAPAFRSPTPIIISGEQRGMMGQADYRRPQDASISAEVMRAMPYRSVASVLRHGREEAE